MPAPGDSLEDRKGEEIKLIGGTAKKHRGYVNAWLDAGRSPTNSFYYVIVEKMDPESPPNTYLEGFKALKSNVVNPEPPPTNYTEAAFQQVPQLEERLIDFAKMVAKCRVPVSQALFNKVAAYCAREIRNQLLKGASAEYRLIDTTGIPNVVEEEADWEEEAEDID